MSHTPDNDLPALPPLTRLRAIMERLRQPEAGCPWDRKQTFDHHRSSPSSSRRPTRSTTRSTSAPGRIFAEELGDLLLQVVLHAQYAAEEGIFDLSDVQRAVTTKIISRHPHVFGTGQAGDAAAGERELGRRSRRPSAPRRARPRGSSTASRWACRP